MSANTRPARPLATHSYQREGLISLTCPALLSTELALTHPPSPHTHLTHPHTPHTPSHILTHTSHTITYPHTHTLTHTPHTPSHIPHTPSHTLTHTPSHIPHTPSHILIHTPSHPRTYLTHHHIPSHTHPPPPHTHLTHTLTHTSIMAFAAITQSSRYFLYVHFFHSPSLFTASATCSPYPVTIRSNISRTVSAGSAPSPDSL